MNKYIDKKFDLKKAMELVSDEDIRQKGKWGSQIHSLFEWLTYTTEELGELAQAICEYEYREGDKEEIVKEAVQTATLCLKIADMVSSGKIPNKLDMELFGKQHQPKQP